MLKLALLLCFAVCIVDIDGASDQCPKDNEEYDDSVQSSEVTRRLNIFESITTSGDHRNDESVNEILQYTWVELTEILRRLESNDPFQAMRVPVHVIPMQLPESLMVFQSLLEMLTNPKESRSPAPWQQYLMESIRNQECSEMDLCAKFDQNFKCDDEGHVKVLTFYGSSTFDHLNLLMIPNTVETLNVNVKRTKLRTISKWTDLKGKSLKTFHLDDEVRDSDLELNLDGLRGELNHLPLEYLSVSTRSIAKYFGGRHWKSALPAIADWMRASTLSLFRLSSPRKKGSRYKVHFESGGSWTMTSKHRCILDECDSPF